MQESASNTNISKPIRIHRNHVTVLTGDWSYLRAMKKIVRETNVKFNTNFEVVDKRPVRLSYCFYVSLLNAVFFVGWGSMISLIWSLSLMWLWTRE